MLVPRCLRRHNIGFLCDGALGSQPSTAISAFFATAALAQKTKVIIFAIATLCGLTSCSTLLIDRKELARISDVAIVGMTVATDQFEGSTRLAAAQLSAVTRSSLIEQLHISISHGMKQRLGWNPLSSKLISENIHFRKLASQAQAPPPRSKTEIVAPGLFPFSAIGANSILDREQILDSLQVDLIGEVYIHVTRPKLTLRDAFGSRPNPMVLAKIEILFYAKTQSKPVFHDTWEEMVALDTNDSSSKILSGADLLRGTVEAVSRASGQIFGHIKIALEEN